MCVNVCKKKGGGEGDEKRFRHRFGKMSIDVEGKEGKQEGDRELMCFTLLSRNVTLHMEECGASEGGHKD